MKDPLFSMKQFITITALIIIVGVCAYFLHNRQLPDVQPTRFSIVCTTSIIGDTIRRLVGDDASVTSLMGPDIDPHLYRAREHDIHTLASANLIIYNGLHLEGKLADVLHSMNRYVPTLSIADHLERSRFIASNEYDTMYDPHIWFDVRIWIDAAAIIRDALMQHDPEHADAYAARAAAYINELEALDTFIREQVSRLAPTQRILVTAHDAFHYFGRAYGFQVVALQGISTESEAGIKDVQELVSFIVEHKVRALFVEASIPERNIQAVQQAARARGFAVGIGDQLYSDALGPVGSPADTYIGMVRHNIAAIISALTA
jgi:manganese/zinc/iron transport system substrate-binding protein